MQAIKRLVLHPNAKINLGLRVERKRSDGYHDLETIFVPLRGLHDELVVEILPSRGDFSMRTVGGYDSGPVEENLIRRAYQGLAPYDPPSVRIALDKRIPVGAGLGGGSADAAFFLQALAPHCGRRVEGTLEALALALGSDCPFFLRNVPCHAKGRGEVLRPLDTPFRAWAVLMSPGVHVSTRWAFEQLRGRSSGAPPVAEVFGWPKSAWPTALGNDFLPVIRSACPEVDCLFRCLQDAGAYYVSLSGSGPTVYGLYEGEVEVPGALWAGWAGE